MERYDNQPMKSLTRSIIHLLPCLALAHATPPVPTAIHGLDGGRLEAANVVDQGGRIRVVATPALSVFPTSRANPRGTILVLPGGGYRHLAVVKEGTATAAFLNTHGYDAAVLEYRVNAGRETRDLALADALQAWRLIRTDAKRLGLRGSKHGILGYSAGGHLAARTAATLEPTERPDLLALIYPAYLGDDPKVVVPENPSGRLFISFAADDRQSWIDSARAYAGGWPGAEFHLFPDGGHGFGLNGMENPAVQSMHKVLPAFLSPPENQ